MGFLGLIQNDIKRVVAYSTLSQLGYMTVALGASAYSVAVFHLMTHAFFKALLFLAAGSVIMGMHHDQDIRNMGGLRKYMPVTWITSLVGSLALIGTPFFSGFYSKDSIIEAVAESHIAGSGFAYFAVVVGVFVTAFYSFRMYFLVFHGKERWREGGHGHADHSHAAAAHAGHDDAHGHDAGHGAHKDEHKHDDHGHHHGLGPNDNPHESPWVVTLPLALLAIPSVVIGYLTIGPMLYGGYFGDAIFIGENHHAMAEMAEAFHGPVAMAIHGLSSLPFWLALAGVVVSAVFYLKRPDIPAAIKAQFSGIHRILENKYGFDDFNQWFFANGARLLGGQLWQRGDRALIDGVMVNGSAGLVGRIAGWVRHGQTGFVYTYAFTMIIGIVAMLAIWLSL
jgi:NADH-quinone oxidoreductase subunit L